ncbi:MULTISPECIES: AAA family ATPase [Asticcacaulis]|uniref:AAA family ATPase n=1 Tax=Asticcacaulis TaxID=76890 RepID=UPI001AE1F875|nr:MULTISPECIES: AAA family ATPase [Asticcacaulis]MBP2159545.1 hypothetical protein [Asticcacaulis solisilvae]MDR6800628.1 hypothetical protein [Asticcacaulis sp. BE141]
MSALSIVPQIEPGEHLTAADASEELIGLFIVHSDVRPVARSVSPEAHYYGVHQAIWRALLAIYAEGGEPLPEAVGARLTHVELRDFLDYGGKTTLENLGAKCGVPSRARPMIELVEAAARRRRQQVLSADLAVAYRDNLDPAPLLAELQALTAEHRKGSLLPLTRWSWTDPAKLPPRQWLYGKQYIRRFVSATVAPGGSGKSALALTEALVLASGRGLLGVLPEERVKVWYLNLEDPLEETQRRVAAACLHYRLKPEDLEGWLMIGSGRDADLIMAAQSRDCTVVNEALVDKLCRVISEYGIGAVIVDPFVSSHRVSENDNGAIDAVVKAWARIADKTGCAVELVHHVKKGQSGVATTMEDSRGAVSLIGAVRSGRVLNAMTDDEAAKAGVDAAWPYFRVNNGKANLAPANRGSEWYRFVSVDLGNGDNVGVVTPWDWPAEAPVKLDDVAKVHAAMAYLADDRGRCDHQSPSWLGHTVADALGLEMPRAKQQIRHMLKAWEDAGYLARVRRNDARRVAKDYFTVGAPPSSGAAVQSGAAKQPSSTTPPLIKRGGGGGADKAQGVGGAA